jgi:hypothetical protein
LDTIIGHLPIREILGAEGLLKHEIVSFCSVLFKERLLPLELEDRDECEEEADC